MDIHTTERDLEEIRQAETFEELLVVARRIIERVPNPACMVCGPITTGGMGSQRANVKILTTVIDDLRAEGKNVFNQLIFEAAMMRIKETPYYKGALHLLETFYRPVFRSGRLKKLYFVPAWGSSFGASWEHEEARRLGIEIVYIPEILISLIEAQRIAGF